MTDEEALDRRGRLELNLDHEPGLAYRNEQILAGLYGEARVFAAKGRELG